MLLLRKNIQVDRSWAIPAGSDTTPPATRTISMDFEVTRPMRLKGAGWVRAVSSPFYPIALWDQAGTLLASGAIPNTGQPGLFPYAIPLSTGQVYRLGVYLTTTNLYSAERATTPPDYIIPRKSHWIASAGIVRPVANATAADLNLLGDFNLTLEETEYEYKAEPPEPNVTSASKKFTISLPIEWMPGDLREWSLQYQRATDNTNFGEWRDIGTFPVGAVPPLEDSAEDVMPFASYEFDPAVYDPPGLFYRFRYKVRTLGKISDWSEASVSGQPKALDAPLAPEDLPPGTPGNPDTDPGDWVSGSTLDGVTIVNSFLQGTLTATDATITGGTANLNAVTAVTGDISSFTAGSVTTTGLSVAGVAIFSDVLSGLTITASNLIYSPLYEGIDINVSGLINGNLVGPGTFNGVTIQDGSIDGQFIEAQTITADKMVTGFLDANVSVSSYIDASAIKGGELILGGRKTYTNFAANDGTFQWPWSVMEMASSSNTLQYVNYPGRPSPPATEKYLIELGNTIRLEFADGEALSGGEGFRLMHFRPNNKVRSMTFTANAKLPTNVVLEFVDLSGTGRPLSVPWSNSGTFTVTATPNVRGDEFAGGLPQGLAFQVRVTSGTTVPDDTYFLELSNVIVEYEKGWGFLNVFDAQDRLRGEFTSEYISFNKPDVIGDLLPRPANSVFYVDNSGVWVPNDGLVIGSSRINNLEYSQRDLSGSLTINPRFENLSTTNPDAILPADWAYLKAGDEGNVEDFGYRDGVLPQNQSLVSGRVLTITLPSGYTDAGARLMAISHKRYVSTEGAEKAPFAMAAHFRTEPEEPKVGIRISLYRSNSAADITTVAQVLADEKLGEKTVNAEDFSGTTVDGEDLFHKISYTYSEATGAAGDTMAITTATGAYVYMVLEPFVRTGQTLTEDKLVEFDNVDLALAEQLTPSDNQPIADLARRVTDIQTLLQYMLSGTKAVLPELSTGVQGLHMTAVY